MLQNSEFSSQLDVREIIGDKEHSFVQIIDLFQRIQERLWEDQIEIIDFLTRSIEVLTGERKQLSIWDEKYIYTLKKYITFSDPRKRVIGDFSEKPQWFNNSLLPELWKDIQIWKSWDNNYNTFLIGELLKTFLPKEVSVQWRVFYVIEWWRKD